MKNSLLAAIVPLAALTSSQNLATTTRYFDGQEGACGCGTSSGNFPWQLGIATGVYTAAGSQALFDTDGATFCGGGCGKCYNLTSTGSSPCSTCGTGEPAGNSIIVMLTNLCPNAGNVQWCPVVGGTNQYGYSYHFDIMAQSEVFGDNPIVQFEPVACPGQATTDWETCVCFGQTATDETPAGLSGATAATSDDAESSSGPPSSDPSSSSASADPAPTSSTIASQSSVATDLTTSIAEPISDPPSTAQDPPTALTYTQSPTTDTILTKAPVADPLSTSSMLAATSVDPVTTALSSKQMNSTGSTVTIKTANATLSATSKLSTSSVVMATASDASRNSVGIDRLVVFALSMVVLTHLL